jgi:hypothetical protein
MLCSIYNARIDFMRQAGKTLGCMGKGGIEALQQLANIVSKPQISSEENARMIGFSILVRNPTMAQQS